MIMKINLTGFTWELRTGIFGLLLAIIAIIYNLYGMAGFGYLVTAVTFILYNERHETYKEWLILALGLVCLAMSTGFFVIKFWS